MKAIVVALVITGLALAAAAAPPTQALALPGSEMAQYFPGSYYANVGRSRLQSRALTYWPGPSGLLQLWCAGELGEREQVALLLGGAAFHDPLLLPVYAEALASPSERVRQAAAVGYRDLLADRVPSVGGGVTLEAAAVLKGELEAVQETLRRRPLVQLWLDTLLAPEGRALSATPGVVLRRSISDALNALDVLVTFHDLPLLAAAYQTTSERAARVGLLSLIEAQTLEAFLQKPQGQRTGWSSTDAHFFAQDLLDNWLRDRCHLDPEDIVRRRVRAMGAGDIDPFSAAGCSLWLPLLRSGEPVLWRMAADRLYACGGPARQLSIRRSDQPDVKQARGATIDWYRPARRRNAP